MIIIPGAVQFVPYANRVASSWKRLSARECICQVRRGGAAKIFRRLVKRSEVSCVRRRPCCPIWRAPPIADDARTTRCRRHFLQLKSMPDVTKAAIEKCFVGRWNNFDCRTLWGVRHDGVIQAICRICAVNNHRCDNRLRIFACRVLIRQFVSLAGFFRASSRAMRCCRRLCQYAQQGTPACRNRASNRRSMI